MWNAINLKKNGELISMDMIFIDEKGNLMHGIIRKNQVNRFKDKLNESSVFIIKNFKVVESIGGYRPVQNSLKIIFLASTAIKNLSEDIVEIPLNGFEFINPDVIDSRVNNNIVLSDVVGCLYGIGDIESIGSKWKNRDIHILNDYLAKAKITLWEEFGEKFCPYLYSNDAGPYTVIVTSTTVKEFRGEISFSTTYASKIYVNLDIDYIRSLAPKFSTMSNEVQIIKSSNVNSLPREEEMFLNRMDIKELLEAEWSSELQYKIHLKVTDRTRDTSFILFNVVAEKLLDTSAHKLFNKLTTTNNDVHVQVQSLCGKEFVFKLRLNHYNLKEGLENFTISKLWIPDDNLEVKYKLRKEEKFMSCKDEIYQSSSSTTKHGKPEKPEDKAEKDKWINVVRETRKELSRQIPLSSLRNIATLKFICTLFGSAGYALLLSATERIFRNIMKKRTLKEVMNVVIWQSFFATCALLIGLFTSG
uniref:Replication protein A 70 kDa DNA-binding subunit B/D first OB fold domain-containing protein n=1 Tax=Solanum lycopersicum TaxID=4081 RepID=A0A3Q7EYD7_SOLLC